MNYLVQSVIFDKSKFSLENARTWLLSNKYKDKGVDEKKNFWRFRQLNPLTIKRKGFSHYITKPLDNSGVELIIAYKEKMEGAGKLNQIKKALFKHFKADEELESKVASTLGRVNKEANDIVKLLEHHDTADDKPQNQIKSMLFKLNNNNNINISGKGLKKKSSIYSKDNKMSTQEAKLYMSGILTTGGSLDLSQDVAFRLKYSFKVGELRKMLKEVLKEKKIELTIKEINKLNKDEIIDLVVKGELITPPALPTSVALAKKYKMADLKREVLKHAGLGEFKKADIINYIEKNKLFEIEEQPNIQLTIEEKVEEAPKVKKSKKPKRKLNIIIEEDEEPKDEEMKLVESVPTGNPKLQMKGIKIGTREMPKEKPKKKTNADLLAEKQIKQAELEKSLGYIKPELIVVKMFYSYIAPGSLSNSSTDINLILKEDDKFIYYTPDIIFDANENELDRKLVVKVDDTGKIIIHKYDKSKKRFKRGDIRLAFERENSFVKLIVRKNNEDIVLTDKNDIKTFFDTERLPTDEEMKQNVPKPKELSKLEQIDKQDKQSRIREYIMKGYLEVDAIEALERDLKYNRDLEAIAKKELSKNKGLEDMELPEKPLTKKEIGDQLEKDWLNEQAEKARKNPELLAKLKANQEKVLEDRKRLKILLPDAIIRTMIYKSIDVKDYKKAHDYLNKIRKHYQYKI